MDKNKQEIYNEIYDNLIDDDSFSITIDSIIQKSTFNLLKTKNTKTIRFTNINNFIKYFYQYMLDAAKETYENKTKKNDFDEQEFLKSQNNGVNNKFENFGNEYIFLDNLRKTLKNKIDKSLWGQKIKREKIEKITEDILEEETAQQAEHLRSYYLKALETSACSKSDMYIQLKMVYKSINNLSPSEVLNFHDELTKYRKESIEFYKKQNNMDLVNFYKNEDIQSVLPFAFSYFTHHLTEKTALSKLISKKISLQTINEDIKNLQTLNNILESKYLMFVDNNILFNGRSFVELNNLLDIPPINNNEIDNLVASLDDFDHFKQSALTYDQEEVECLLKEDKFKIAVINKTKTIKNETSTIELTLLSDRWSSRFFLKEKVVSKDEISQSLSFYALPSGKLDSLTQIYRIDKVPKISYREKSKHIQTSGEEIITHIHSHDYNLFDKAYNFSKKNLGKFDIGINFDNISDDITNKDLEVFFDNKCNITKFNILMRQKEKSLLESK